MAKAKAKVKSESTDPRQNVLDAVLGQFGAGSLMDLSGDTIPRVDVIPTGSIGLDRALGVGGFPRGRIVEIYGPESSGKTTITLHAIANAQKEGLLCGFVDAEHAIDLSYAQALGVKTKELLLSQPDNGEQALEIVDTMARTGSMGLIIVDSVAALVPKAELDGDMGAAHVGLQARLMSQAMRKLSGAASTTNTTIIFINQIRMKIGVMFGSPETTSGGNALKYYSSMRLDIRRIGGVKDKGSEKLVANRTRVRIKKNKLAPPFLEAEFDIRYGQGVDRYAELVEIGVELGLVEKAGAWLSYGGKRVQGRDALMAALREDVQMRETLESAVLSA